MYLTVHCPPRRCSRAIVDLHLIVSNTKHFRTDIQALRTIAVLAVVIYHLWPGRLTGGFMGVDVFFVISGYLMTSSISRNIQSSLDSPHRLRSSVNFLTEFYARRIKRLVPAAATTLIAILALVWLTGKLDLIATTAKQVAAAAVFGQNLYLANESVDYLAAATPPTAVQHFWSLSLEEQFYLAWPLLLLILSLLTVHLTVTRKGVKIPGALWPTAALAALFFFYGYALTQSNPAAAYFVTFARVWELLLGALLVFVPTITHTALRLLLPWLGTAMIGYALIRWDGTGFPGWHALVPVLGTAFVILGGVSPEQSRFSFGQVLRYRPIQWVGDISYSLYLWHWPLIVLVPVLLTMNIDGEHRVPLKFGILAASFVIAWLSYRFVEQPAQKNSFGKRRVYSLFALITVVIFTAGVASAQQAEQQSTASLQEMHELVLSPDADCAGGRALADPEQCGKGFDSRDPRFSSLGSTDQFTTLIRTGEGCAIFHPTPDSTPDPTLLCDVGALTSQKRITLWGDSHANHWINALDQIGRDHHIKFTILSSGQCAAMDANEPLCNDRMAFIRDSGILDDSDAILLSLWFRYGPDAERQPTQEALDVLASLTDTPVYLLQDIPPAGVNGGPDCDTRGLSCTNSVEAALSSMNGAYEQMVARGTLDPDRIIKTSDMFCDATTCYSFIGGLPVYQSNALADDASAPEGNAHMTASYSLTLAELLAAKLDAKDLLTQ